MNDTRIPENTIKRLPMYLQVLDQLELESLTFIHSHQMERYLDIKPTLMRKDLSYFGELGIRGKGYQINLLKEAIKRVLGITEKKWRTAIIGTGNIGKALLHYPAFTQINVEIIAAFDIDPEKTNQTINHIPIYHTEQMIKWLNQETVEFVMLCTPASGVDKTVSQLVQHTPITGIINFTSRYIQVAPPIKVININITSKVLTMLFHLTHPNGIADAFMPEI